MEMRKPAVAGFFLGSLLPLRERARVRAITTKSGVARQQVTFLCLPTRKVTKEKGTLCRGASHSPVLLAKPGGNQTRPSRAGFAYPAAELEQVIAESPRLGCAARRDRKGICREVAVVDTANCLVV